ncbi:hypothetical protein Gpo141_00003874 [Globisporangium polare]
MSRHFVNPFPPLQLTPEDATQLEGLANAFVRNAMDQYERFAFKEQYNVDERRWKPVLQRENIKAFAERRQISGSNGSGYHTHDDFPDVPVTNAKDLPVLLLCGTLEGSLDDVLYGYTCPTLDAMRLKTSYIDDQLVGSAILETLVEPSEEDPFRSLTIKWFEKGRPLHVRALTKNRDFVYMESTGVNTLSNGERIGYHLMHSVHFPQTRELDTVVRGNMSVSGIYRQRTHNQVDVYIRGVLNPAGGLMRSIIIKSASNGLMSSVNYMHCAERKKLVWLLRRRRELFKAQRVTSELSESAVSSSASGSAAAHHQQCSYCGKRPSTFSVMTKSSSGSKCRVCLQHVCSSCKIKKKLSFIARDQQLVQTDVTFCGKCVDEAAQLNALQVARDEVANPEAVTWSDAYARSAGSSSSRGDELSTTSSGVSSAY